MIRTGTIELHKHFQIRHLREKIAGPTEADCQDGAFAPVLKLSGVSSFAGDFTLKRELLPETGLEMESTSFHHFSL